MGYDQYKSMVENEMYRIRGGEYVLPNWVKDDIEQCYKIDLPPSVAAKQILENIDLVKKDSNGHI